MSKKVECPVCHKKFETNLNSKFAVNGTLVCSEECLVAYYNRCIKSKVEKATTTAKKSKTPKATVKKAKSVKVVETPEVLENTEIFETTEKTEE